MPKDIRRIAANGLGFIQEYYRPREYLLRLGYYIFRLSVEQGLVDVTTVNNEGEILLFDAMKECRRVYAGRKKADRGHRPRTEAQKRLGARLAYVDMETRNVHIVPPFGKKRSTLKCLLMNVGAYYKGLRLPVRY